MKNKSQDTGFALGKKNYIMLAVGFVVIIIGFVLLSGGGSSDPNIFNGKELFSVRRIIIAPVIILAGFIFEIYAIMKKPVENDTEKEK